MSYRAGDMERIQADRSELMRDKALLLTQLTEARALLREALEWTENDHAGCAKCSGARHVDHSLPCRIRQAVQR